MALPDLADRALDRLAVVQAEYSVSRSILAALAMLVWDILLTFDDEVDFVWNRPGVSWTKFLFWFTRYFPLNVLISHFASTRSSTSPSICKRWIYYRSTCIQLLLASVDSLLILRVYALFNKSCIVTGILLALWIVENGVIAWTISAAVPAMEFVDHCFIDAVKNDSMVFQGLSMCLFQSVLFGLTLYKACAAARGARDWPALIKLVIRDGTWCFAVTLAAVITNTGMTLGSTNALNSIAFPWVFSMCSACASRLTLNMLHLQPDPAPVLTPPAGSGAGSGASIGTFSTDFAHAPIQRISSDEGLNQSGPATHHSAWANHPSAISPHTTCIESGTFVTSITSTVNHPSDSFWSKETWKVSGSVDEWHEMRSFSSNSSRLPSRSGSNALPASSTSPAVTRSASSPFMPAVAFGGFMR